MKRILPFLIVASVCMCPAAQQGYYRFAALYGENVIFTSEGDLWIASLNGGPARRITSNLGTESFAAVSPDGKLIAFHRWENGGPGDDVVVVANFANRSYGSYTIGFPQAGSWRVRFNSDWQGYSENFEGYRSTDLATEPGEYDGLPFRAALSIGSYSVLIFSQ